ncbi:MAG: peptidoglycan-binding protein [Candidatus Paceibacterota bacterium]|jgi:hypothetical protein
MENKTPQTKTKSSSFLIFFLLLILVALALISVPKENWKKIFSLKSYNLAAVFDSPESLGVCTNGSIYTSLIEGSILYYGGSFTEVGACTGAGVPINVSTGQAVASYPQVIGEVYASVSDGAGGWYIGGAFTYVDNQARNGMAHILADGTVDSSFNPDMGEYAVRSLTISDNILYVGGAFPSFYGLPRNSLAAYDITNATVTSFNPNSTYTGQSIYSLVVSSSTLYVGGEFSDFGNLGRNNIAAYDLINATTTDFNPSPNAAVYALAVSSSTLYAGGGFTNFGGLGRNYLAAYDLLTDTVTDFSLNIGANAVKALTISDGIIYVGGQFSTFEGLDRIKIAAYDLVNATTTDFDPGAGANSAIYTLAVSDSYLYIGGEFTTFGGLPRTNFAIYDLANATTSDLIVNAGSAVKTLALSDSTLYIGGTFDLLGSQTRNRLAAYDLVNRNTTDFNPNVGWYSGHAVYTLTISDNILYVGGWFDIFDGLTRSDLAAYNLLTDTTTDFDPGITRAGFSPYVYSIAISDDILYAGGQFDTFGGFNRNNIAAYNILTATTTDFNPGVGGTPAVVNALTISSSTLYVGGNFTTFGDLDRNRLAAYDIANATTTDFNPGPIPNPGDSSTINSLLIATSTLYAGGYFTNFGGLPRKSIASYDLVNATTTSLNIIPTTGSSVRTMTIFDSILFVGGSFTTFNGLTRNSLAAYDLDVATTTSFNPNPQSGDHMTTAYTLSLSGSTLYAAGNFSYFSSSVFGSIISVRDVELETPIVADISATLKANITSTAGETITARGFRYGTTTEYAMTTKESSGFAVNKNKIGSMNVAAVYTEPGSFSTGEYSADITGLSASTTYHYQAFITDRLGTTYSSDATFTTLALSSGHRSPSSGSTEVSTVPSTTTTLALATSSSTEEIEEAPGVTSTPNLPSGFCFTKNLHQYTTDSDIKNLQIFLNSQGFNASTKGSETTYYGSKTILAVHSFQEYYADDILAPFGLAEGTGNFGNATRKKANDILGCETIPEVSAPVIPKVETPKAPENTIPEVITDIVETPTQEQQTETSAGTETNQNVVPDIGVSAKQGYDQVISIAKNAIANTRAIVNTPTGSAVTKVISTTGIIAGATISISAIAFATPISFSEIWLIPARILALLLSALGIKRKQRQWGTVYDSVTKRPLDPVYVSLISIETGKEVAGAITDIDGRYGFLVLPGKYKIVATKTNYIQPSKKMAGRSFDEVYNDLYFGEEMTVETEGAIITKNIPMDSLSFDWNEFAKTKMNVNKFMKQKDITWAKISSVIFFIGAIVAFIAVIFAPAPYNFIIAGFYIVAYILNYVVLKTKKSGTLTEKHTKAPLSFAIVSIFREGEDTPLTKKIADKFGAYYALVPNGKYSIKVEKKKDDGTYTEVFKTEAIEIKTGVINMNLVV